MPKKILFHSAVHHFVSAAKSYWADNPMARGEWDQFVDSLSFSNVGNGELEVQHAYPNEGTIRLSIEHAHLYQRGDIDQSIPVSLGQRDPVFEQNADVFKTLVLKTAGHAGLNLNSFSSGVATGRILNETEFHDEWAKIERGNEIDVRRSNEVCTAPEMRYIVSKLGDLRGKRLLDVGCGLGEASVYFALKGADVTASDVSPGMLERTRELAARNGVHLATALSSSESLQLPETTKFDIIYIGNTLHHVDIAQTMRQLMPHLAENGAFASWDPVAYNPLINVYRRVAVDVRTPDEHPLKLSDVRRVRSCFKKSEAHYFWLTTLAIFVLMVLQRRSPNRERFWKKVIEEADKWQWLYQPLERIDHFLLRWLPFLRPLCWNVVIIGRNPVDA